MKLIKDFEIGQTIKFSNSIIKIINYAGTVLFKNIDGVAEMQLYIIEFNNEIMYASNSGLLSGKEHIFDKIIAKTGYRGNINIENYIKEYDMWKDMIYRCCLSSNRLYPYYGGIGITIDPKWYCFELFLYDLVNVQNYDSIKNTKYIYVIDIQSKQKKIPEEQRIYAPGRISIKHYYQSDVYINTEKAKMSGNYQNAGSYIDSTTVIKNNTPRVTKINYKPLSDGSYPINAYDNIIKNPPNLPMPDNDDLGFNIIRTFNGVHYKNSSLINPVSKVNDKKIMCVIVDKNK